LARDTAFVKLLLDHTVKTIDKCDGAAKATMVAQAERLRTELRQLQDAALDGLAAESQRLGLDKVDGPMPRRSSKKTTKRKAKKRTKR